MKFFLDKGSGACRLKANMKGNAEGIRLKKQRMITAILFNYFKGVMSLGAKTNHIF